MKNLKLLSDGELEHFTKQAALQERLKMTEVLEYLKECDLRRLYSKRGYSSLFEFTVKVLGYSEGAAHRRIKSMRLMKTVPQIKENLEKGNLNLTQAALVQVFFEKEKKLHQKEFSQEKKQALLMSVQQKSKRELEIFLNEQRTVPLPLIPEKVEPLTQQSTYYQFTGNEEFTKNLEELKNWLGFELKDPSSLVELMTKMSELALQALKKKKGIDTQEKKQTEEETETEKKQKKEGAREVAEKPTSPENLVVSPKPIHPNTPTSTPKAPAASRYIPRPTKRALFQGNPSKTEPRISPTCNYTDPKTKRRCSSQFSLQIEHIHPYAKGGTSSPENLELLCPAHNQLRAIQRYGERKMRKYFQQASRAV